MTDPESTRITKTTDPAPSLVSRVMQCRAEGLGRNAVARLLGVSTRQVDNISREHNITWDSQHVAVANRARGEQAKAKRMELAEQFRTIASLELQAVLNGEFEPPGVRKERLTIAAIAVDKDLAIAKHLGDDAESADMEEAKDMMERFMFANKARVIDMPDQPGDH